VLQYWALSAACLSPRRTFLSWHQKSVFHVHFLIVYHSFFFLFFFFFESDLLSLEARPHVGLYIRLCYSSGPSASFESTFLAVLGFLVGTPRVIAPYEEPARERCFWTRHPRNVRRSSTVCLNFLKGKDLSILPSWLATVLGCISLLIYIHMPFIDFLGIQQLRKVDL